MLNKYIISFHLIALLTLNLYSDETKPTIAVLSLKTVGVAESDAVFMCDFLTQDLIKTNKFRVVERSNIDKILAEQGFQQSGCTESECAVKIGQILNLKYAVVGSIGWLADKYIVNANIVNIETGEIVFATDYGVPTKDKVRSISNIIAKRIERYLVEGKIAGIDEYEYEMVLHMPKIKVLKGKEVIIDRGKEARLKKREIYNILGDDNNTKIGKLRITDIWYGGSTAKIVSKSQNSKVKPGLKLEYYGTRKRFSIGGTGRVTSDSNSSNYTLYCEYVKANDWGLQINVGGSVREDEGLDKTYIRRLPIILKKHHNYDGDISPYAGGGLAVYINRKSGRTVDDGLCLVLNAGIDIFAIRTVHFSIDVKYYFNYIASGNILATTIGVSYNW